MIRAVLDANVVASSLIQPKGASGRTLQRFLSVGDFQLITAEALLEEARKCIFYPRVRKRIRSTDEEIDTFLTALAVLSDVVEVTLYDLTAVPRDPDDSKYLAVALEGMATHVVSGDRDLLDMGEYQGIAIVTPARFIALLDV
ncbi:MAG: putative toxin-antitoxin system toxin component, PIN family [Candidatus Riflebacteria bacterium]|nr:putative toxin-antitoxin system toxin component, PIN family [Candidatus Riflebacteria bacterium]